MNGDEVVEGQVRPSDPRLRRLADLKAGNDRELAVLAARRVTADFTPLRLKVLLDLIFTEDDRLTYELAYEEARAVELAKVRSKAALVVPAAGNGR